MHPEVIKHRVTIQSDLTESLTLHTELCYSRAMARRRGILGDPGGLFGLDGLRGFRSGAACCTVKVCRKSATSHTIDYIGQA